MTSAHDYPATGPLPARESRTDRMAMATAERAELSELLSTLAPDGWETGSLCRGWSVKDVANHVVSYDDLTVAGVASRMVRGRLGVHGANAVGVAEGASVTAERVLEAYRRNPRPRGLTAVAGGRIAFLDGLIHHQDIRRALGRPRPIPAERLVQGLEDAPAAFVLPARKLSAGLSFVATDVDWSHGSGPEVRGPAEAILMAIAGRVPALRDLSGPGVTPLSERAWSLQPA